MFPSCKVTVTGLNPKVKYMVIMDMVPFDNHKYKWNKDQWEVNGSTDPHLPNRFFIHPDSPASGEKWMQYPISFHKLKLTNNTLNSSGLVVLHSMHKYQPRLHIVQSPDPCNPHMPGGYLRFPFPEAAFIAVTAYQNQEIKKLKIDNNPFAKGFRDNGLNRKRLRDKETQEIQDQQVKQNLSLIQNERVGELHEDEHVDETVSSSVDHSGSVNSSDSTLFMANPFISAFINPSSAGVSSPQKTHTILSLSNRSLNSPNEIGLFSLQNLCTSLPMAQSSTVDANLNRLPSQTSSPLIPQHHHSPVSQTPCRPIIHPIQAKNPQLQPYFHTPPHHFRQCPDVELPLSLPPKLSRMQLPESALKNLEVTPFSNFVHLRPLTNIINRIHVRALAPGTTEKVLQNPFQHEQHVGDTERELGPQISQDVQEYISQQFAMNSMMTQQAKDNHDYRSQMDYNARPLVEFYCKQQV